MTENYKHLYEQTKKMLTMYQDNLIPGFRQKIDELEADNERLRKGWAEAVSAHSKADSLIPRWIPVSERLPDEKELVLCVGAKGGLFLGYPRWISHKDTAYTSVPNARGGRYTKYWMQLPEAPKEE